MSVDQQNVVWRKSRIFKHDVGPSDLSDLSKAVQRALCAETSSARDWSADAPHRGHSDVVALIVQYAYGGTIECGRTDGVYHYWNRIDGYTIDLSGTPHDADAEFVYCPNGATNGLRHVAQERFDILFDRIRI